MEARMRRRYPMARARQQLARIVDEVQSGASVELTRRGKPVARVTAFAPRNDRKPPRNAFWKALLEFRRHTDLKRLRITDADFTGLRDRSPGRECSW